MRQHESQQSQLEKARNNEKASFNAPEGIYGILTAVDFQDLRVAYVLHLHIVIVHIEANFTIHQYPGPRRRSINVRSFGLIIPSTLPLKLFNKIYFPQACNVPAKFWSCQNTCRTGHCRQSVRWESQFPAHEGFHDRLPCCEQDFQVTFREGHQPLASWIVNIRRHHQLFLIPEPRHFIQLATFTRYTIQVLHSQIISSRVKCTIRRAMSCS